MFVKVERYEYEKMALNIREELEEAEENLTDGCGYYCVDRDQTLYDLALTILGRLGIVQEGTDEADD